MVKPGSAHLRGHLYEETNFAVDLLKKYRNMKIGVIVKLRCFLKPGEVFFRRPGISLYFSIRNLDLNNRILL